MHGKKNRTKWLVFEGIDGSGKTTLINALKAHLGPYCVCVKEPSPGTALERCIRKVIAGKGLSEEEYRRFKISKKESLLYQLFTRERFRTYFEETAWALGRFPYILQDRSLISTSIYQNIDYSTVKKDSTLTLPIIGDFFPFVFDHVFIIDIDPETAWKRLEKRGKMDKFETIEMLRVNREKYLRLSEREGFHVINGEKNAVIQVLKVIGQSGATASQQF